MDRLGGDSPGGPEGRRPSSDLGFADQYTADQYTADQYTQESYRVPDARRPGDPGMVLGPRSGVELPPLPFATEPPSYAPEGYPVLEPGAGPPPGTVPPEPEPGGAPRGGHHSERTTVRRAGGAGSHSGLYFARRAGLVGVLTAVAVVAELLLIRVLVTGEFGHTVVPGSVLGSMCAMAGIPLVTIGLYGVMTGMPAAAPRPAVAWSRAPLAYLPVGLVLLLAASLAVR